MRYMKDSREKQGKALASEQAPRIENKVAFSNDIEEAPVESLARKGLDAAGVSVRTERVIPLFSGRDIQPQEHKNPSTIIDKIVGAFPAGILAGYIFNVPFLFQIFSSGYGMYHGLSKTPFSAFFGKAVIAGAFVGLSLAAFTTFVFPPAYILASIVGSPISPFVASLLMGVVTTIGTTFWYGMGRALRAGIDFFVK